MAVDFCTPLLVRIKWDEVENPKQMLAEWKEEHLSGWYLELWTEMKERDAAGPQKKGLFGWLKFAVKWFWPLLTLALLANVLTGSSVFFLSFALVPIQLIVTLWLILKTLILLCLVSAYLLEKEIGK